MLMHNNPPTSTMHQLYHSPSYFSVSSFSQVDCVKSYSATKKSFSTRFKIFIDAIGLLVALGSGAAKVSLRNQSRLIMP